MKKKFNSISNFKLKKDKSKYFKEKAELQHSIIQVNKNKEFIQNEIKNMNNSSNILINEINNLKETSYCYLNNLDLEYKKYLKVENEISSLKDKKNNQNNNDFKSLNIKDIDKEINKTNKLNEAKNIKINEIVAKNKQIKNKINSMRKERTIYDNLYKSLEVKILNKRENIKNLIKEKSIIKNLVYKEENQLKKIKEATNNKEEIIKYEIDKLKEYQYKSNIVDEYNYTSMKDINMDNISKEINKVNKNSYVNKSFLSKFINVNDNKINEVEDHKYTINKLKKLTFQDDINVIINYYDNGEEENNRLYEKNINLENNIENLTEEIKNLKSKIQYIKSNNFENNKEKLILLNKCNNMEIVNNNLINKKETLKNNLNKYIKIINYIKQNVEYDHKFLDTLKNEDIREDNIELFFKPIENWVQNLLYEYVDNNLNNSQNLYNNKVVIKEENTKNWQYLDIINSITLKDNEMGREKENLITEKLFEIKNSLLKEIN